MTEQQAQAVVAEAARFGIVAELRQVCGPPNPDYGVEALDGELLAFSMDQLWHELIWFLPPERWASIPPPGGPFRGHTGACMRCDTGEPCRAKGYWSQYGYEAARQLALLTGD